MKRKEYHPGREDPHTVARTLRVRSAAHTECAGYSRAAHTECAGYSRAAHTECAGYFLACRCNTKRRCASSR